MWHIYRGIHLAWSVPSCVWPWWIGPNTHSTYVPHRNLVVVDNNMRWSVLASINILFGNVFSLFKTLRLSISLKRMSRPLTFPEAGRTIRLCTKLWCGVLSMHRPLLAATTTNISVLGEAQRTSQLKVWSSAITVQLVDHSALNVQIDLICISGSESSEYSEIFRITWQQTGTIWCFIWSMSFTDLLMNHIPTNSRTKKVGRATQWASTYRLQAGCTAWICSFRLQDPQVLIWEASCVQSTCGRFISVGKRSTDHIWSRTLCRTLTSVQKILNALLTHKQNFWFLFSINAIVSVSF